jgi:vancomycin aglycone glucosyltransferase
MKVLIAVEGTEGDIRPPLAVAGKLAERGHSVRACVPEDYVPYYRELGIEAHPMGITTKDFVKTCGKSLGKPLQYLHAVQRIFAPYLEQQFDTLLTYADWADVILAAGFVFAAGTAAEEARRPMAHLVHAPVYLCSSTIPPACVGFSILPRFVNRGLCNAFWQWMDRVALEQINRRRSSLGLHALASIKEYILAPMVLAMDRELAPMPADCQQHGFIQTSYPWIDDLQELPPRLERFLEGGPAPVFFTFGSVPDAQSERTMEMLRRTAERIGCRMVIQQPSKENCPDLRPRLLAVHHLPHARIFPRVAAVVHHGGSGTFHSAARAGAPQVTVPFFFDQYYAAHRVAVLGLGPKPIHRRMFTANRLEKAVCRVLEDPGYRTRSQAMAETLKGRDGAADAADLLETLVQRGRVWP